MELKTVRDVLMYMGATIIKKRIRTKTIKIKNPEPEDTTNRWRFHREYNYEHIYETKELLSMGGRMKEADLKFINNNLDRPIMELFLKDGLCLVSFEHRKGKWESLRIFSPHLPLISPNQYIERVYNNYLSNVKEMMEHVPKETIIIKAPDFENRMLAHALDNLD